MLLINQRNCLTAGKEFSFLSGILLVLLSRLSFLQLSLSPCQHLAVRDKHHQTPKYPTALAQLGTHRKQCAGSRSQASSSCPAELRHADRHPHCCTLRCFSLFVLLLGFGILCWVFLLLIVVQMFYVWWITSPTHFLTCFSSSAQSIYTYLNSHLDLIKKSLPVGFLTVDLHVWPDFHGNRSPLTDLTLKGMVRNSLSLQKGQYRVKKKNKKKNLEGDLILNILLLSYLNCPIGFGFLAAFWSVLKFQ